MNQQEDESVTKKERERKREIIDTSVRKKNSIERCTGKKMNQQKSKRMERERERC
jgi:hypothetical protein